MQGLNNLKRKKKNGERFGVSDTERKKEGGVKI